MSKLDVGALKRAIAKEQALAIGAMGPGGRPRTGTKAFVRQHLDTILKLREDTQATWAQMVTALGEAYDLRGGDGQPISGRRLNALVSACLKEKARKEAATAARASRADVTRTKPMALTPRRGRESVGDAAPAAAALNAGLDTVPVSEDEIRRAQQARRQHLFKRG